MTDHVEVYALNDEGDGRGHAWHVGKGVDFISVIEDVHLMTLNPGGIRGNHFHLDKREILIVEHDGEWVLFWDDGLRGEPQKRHFECAGAVAVLVPPGCAHAIENCGGGPMRIVSISDRPYDPDTPDSHCRVLRKPD